VKVLFIARHFTYFRNFESVVAELARRGHRICLAAERDEALGGRELVERLASRHPGRVEVTWTPRLEEDAYRPLASALRLGLDHLRYTEGRYESTPKIRERAFERTPHFAVLLARTPFRRAGTAALTALEAAVPRPGAVDAFLEAQAPDVLLMTPLIELGSPQLDYVRAARRRGIASALCVWSWDHLSSKALIREVPDRVFVWNEAQREEAQRFHGVASERIVVTGAQCFDQWFDREPARDRPSFCARVGLPADRPLILYVCSALFKNSPSEAELVREWIRALRRAPDARLRDAAVLVRPHPQRLEEWQDRGALEGCGPAVLWGSNPVDHESRADYFDSMCHAAAVVGLNTSALVEAAIVDRPVFTLLLPEFRDNQEGTFHFHHLLRIGNGFLHTTHTLDEHAAQLSAVLSGGRSRPNRPFVEQFIRPRGMQVAATPIFVEAVETLARGEGLGARAEPARTHAMRPIVRALRFTTHVPVLERLYWTSHRTGEWQQTRRSRRERDARRRTRRQDKAWRLARKMPQQALVRLKTAAKHALGAAGLIRQP
jgi:hypothetical protein